MVAPYLYKTDGVAINITNTTFTHGLGVAPAGLSGEVRFFATSMSGNVGIVSSSSQIVTLIANVTTTGNLCVQQFWSGIGGSSIQNT
jgi:hypothetical protein